MSPILDLPPQVRVSCPRGCGAEFWLHWQVDLREVLVSPQYEGLVVRALERWRQRWLQYHECAGARTSEEVA